eukprot:scaffold37742_cov150-Skeletonema_marinoi.AAC.1
MKGKLLPTLPFKLKLKIETLVHSQSSFQDLARVTKIDQKEVLLRTEVKASRLCINNHQITLCAFYPREAFSNRSDREEELRSVERQLDP